MTVVWAFPGQGAQRVGMGADVLDRYPGLVREADEILGYSLREVCLKGAEPGLKDTRSVQPALFVVNALGFLARLEDHPAPDCLAGHSLGEYDALFAAGCFDFATGVRLVQRRGELMGRAGGGGMLAVLGADPDRIHEVLQRSGIDDVDAANRNSASQVVLAGPQESLRRAAQALRTDASVRCVPLQVSAPFHSRYMTQAAAEYDSFLAGIDFADPRIPVIANVTARPYPPGGVRELLARQVAAPVCWWESMSLLLDRGVTEFVEIGPGRTLTGLWEAARTQPALARPSAHTPTAAEARGMAPPTAESARVMAPPRAESAPAIPPRAPTAPARPSVTGTTTPPPPTPAPIAGSLPCTVRPERLGSAEFRADYGLRHAYLAGSMYKGIASTDLVVRMARAGLMGYFGSGGLTPAEVDSAIREIADRLGPGARFGVNLLAAPESPGAEREQVELLLKHDVRFVEAAAFTGVTAPVVRFRFAGAHRTADGTPVAVRHVLAKVSRPEVATAFLSPPPGPLLDALVAEGALSSAEAQAAALLPVAGDVCVEADSGGHTDAGSPYALMPAMIRLRDSLMAEHRYPRAVRVGAAGGLGSPESVAAAFVLGADFVVTGSVNQCSPEAGTSDAVKDLLATLDVQDTTYAPAGDLFELGARVQVVRRSTLFPARANKLYQLYRRYDGLDEIDASTRQTLEERYFRRSFDDIWAETGAYLRDHRPDELARAERNPKVRMAQVFRWYFVHSTRLALGGVPGEQVNYQIHCGPAMGAFNRLVAGTPLEAWRNRHVDAIAELLMTGAAALLDGSLRAWSVATPGD
ncbi:ACP S-malonyltransferase [Streptomyces sp. NPDC127197]|uniref:ACP S-malonyltransferase n=1 Tax=Streptomyces sp. NPDC127197 TaxID=3345388 RepID=UPI00363FB9DF